MKIKNSQLIETCSFIQAMPNLKKAPVALFALAKNLNKMKILLKDFDEARTKVWKEHFDEDVEVKKEDPRFPAFIEAEKKILQTEVEILPQQFLLNDLNLEANEISPVSLSSISWLVSDF